MSSGLVALWVFAGVLILLWIVYTTALIVSYINEGILMRKKEKNQQKVFDLGKKLRNSRELRFKKDKENIAQNNNTEINEQNTNNKTEINKQNTNNSIDTHKQKNNNKLKKKNLNTIKKTNHKEDEKLFEL